ncbi:MAG: hypothetical protein RLZZ210_1098 [Pseudomonadota bacterium]
MFRKYFILILDKYRVTYNYNLINLFSQSKPINRTRYILIILLYNKYYSGAFIVSIISSNITGGASPTAVIEYTPMFLANI